MRPEEVIELIDSNWFAMGVFQEKSISSIPASSEAKSDLDAENHSTEKTEFKAFARIPTIHTRSMSDQLGSNLSFTDSFSPDSDFSAPKLLPILSGKEMTEETPRIPSEIEEIEHKKKLISRRRAAKKAASKSLSELEFEELKGFMDLGFVFTEEDNNDSRLVEIVPGLQRLGKNKKEEEIKERNDVVQEAGGVSRPYLSEAWEVMEGRRRRKEEEAAAPLMMMKWKIPDLSNEIGMKDSLKWWAHTVASTVR